MAWRERWRAVFKGRGLLIFGGALILLIAALVAAAFMVLRPKPPTVATFDGPAFCRPCAALSRFERSMSLALEREDLAALPREDRVRIVDEVAGWRRRCSTLLCSRPTGEQASCKAPSASLLTELASIDSLAESLTRRTALCAQGGCQSARCEQASAATLAFAGLHEDLRALAQHPSALISERRHISTNFMFDQLATLDDTVLAAPDLVAKGRFAAAEGGLLILRDAAANAEANAPESAEGLLAGRIEEVSASIEALAQSRRAGTGGSGIASLWREFAEASARLLIEGATLRAEMQGQGNVFEAVVRPEAVPFARGQQMVCEGTVRLVRSTEQRIAEAMGQLQICNLRADCAGQEIVTDAADAGAAEALQPPPASGRLMLEELASEREAAATALRPLAFQKDADIGLTTDLQQYFTAEAIAVRPLSENNRCFTDRGARLSLTRLSANSAEKQTLETHALDPADSAALLFAAPEDPGTYRFVLETSEARGSGEFGASSAFAVTAPASGNGCSGLNGRWQTDFGVLTLYVRDALVRGSYRQPDSDRAGVLVGSVSGGIFTGRWTSELGDGGARLTLSEDGASFSGTWSQYPDQYSGTGRWDGQCLGPVAPPAASAEEPAEDGQ